MRAECHAGTFMNDVDGDRVAWKPRLRLLVVIPLAAAAVLAVLWFRSHAGINGMRAVVAASAAMEYRPSLARLSGDFPFREVKPAQRGTNVKQTIVARRLRPPHAVCASGRNQGGRLRLPEASDILAPGSAYL